MAVIGLARRLVQLLLWSASAMSQSMSVSQVMSRPVVVITPETPTAEVLAVAESRQIHHFPIVQAGQLVGFVCTCDLLNAAPRDPVMPLAWHHPATVSPTCSAKSAAKLLLLHGVGSLVIVDPQGIRGIVTRDDLRHASPELEELLEPARCVSCGAGEHLRPGPNGSTICVRCKPRARSVRVATA
jgi:signal-transduction protein with cAMP-binding, CBS, and nucleotidyltransferase domain